MFGKVLLLALVCVAATEVVDSNLNTIIQEGIKEVNNIHDRTIFVLNNVLAAYYDNDFYIYNTVREQVRNLGRHSDIEVDAVKATAQKLTNLAHQTNAKAEVFICISDRRDDTIQNLRDHVSRYDGHLTEEADAKRQELFNLAHDLFKFRSSILFRDSIHQIRDEIRECRTPECVREVVTRYNNENVKITAGIRKTTPKLNLSTEKSQKEIRNTLIAAKRETSQSKGEGIHAMRACFVKTN